MLLARHLESLPGHVAKYAGTLNVFGPVELGDFLAIYRAFQKGIRKRFGESVQLRPVAEIGPRNGRVHLHYAMTGDSVEVTKADVSEVWRDACGNRRIEVDHRPIDDVSTWARYMFKADWKYYEPGNRDCVVLFSKGSPRLPQGTRDFLPAKVKATLWDEWKAQRHPESEVVETRSGTVVPQYDPVTNVRERYGKSTGKTVGEDSQKIRINVGKESVKVQVKCMPKRFSGSRLCVYRPAVDRHWRSPNVHRRNGRSGFGGDRRHDGRINIRTIGYLERGLGMGQRGVS